MFLARNIGAGPGPAEDFWYSPVARATAAGVAVSAESAMRLSTVYKCVRVRAETVGMLPLMIYKRRDDGGKEPATDHPLYGLLHDQPNPWQTSFQWRQMVGLHLAFCSNHYSFLNRVGGRIVEIIPFDPGQMRVRLDPQTYVRTYTLQRANGQTQEFPEESIWHIRGLSWGTLVGLETLSLAREALGLSMALEDFQSNFHANGARPSGVLSVPGKLTEEQYKKLRAWLESEHGRDDPAKPMIVDQAAQWIQQTMSGVDAQTLESRKYQVEEVCRAFGVMPIMVGFSDKAATYASAEQMFLAHVVHTLAPWYELIEQDVEAKLLTEADRRAGIYPKFVAQGLMRGALKDTAEYLVKLTSAGIMTRNEARAKIELDALDGLDEPLTPMNMATPANDSAPKGDDDPADDKPKAP